MDFKYTVVTNDTLRNFRPYIIPQLFDRMQFPDIVMIGALDADNIPCGFMAIRCDDRGFAELIWIFVSKYYRLLGCGRGFIEYVRPLLAEAGIDRLYALSARQRDQEDGLLERFYKSFDIKESLLNDHFVTVDAMKLYERFSNFPGSADNVCGYIDEVDINFLTKVYESLDEDIKTRLNPGIERAGGDMVKAFDKCSVLCTSKDKLSGLLLFFPGEDSGVITLIAMKTASPNVLADMFRFSINRALKSHGNNLRITFAPLNNIGEMMGNHFKAPDWIAVKAYEFL